MTKMGIQFHAVIAILACALSLAYATDPGLLQDFCVSTDDTNAAVSVNGMFCKNPQHVTSDDFFFSGLNIPGNTSSNPFGSYVRFALVDQFPGLNTLGISMVRIDFARQGLNPPHSHPRASELLFVVEGTLYAGFVTSNPDHRLFTKILHPGDAFVFPQGLIHFQLNVGRGRALAYASLSSQSPGVITLANSVFGADPPINSDVLTKGFQLDRKVVDYLQSLEWTNNGNY